MSTRIFVGDCRAILPTLEAQSVHCVVTSPPYFGLRSYGTPPQIWGGEADCEHDWKSDRYYVEGGGGAKSSGEAFSEPGPANAERIKQARWREDDTCLKCAAWRGNLGLEPTLDMFINHLVAVFREVRRVLRDDGTLWLNMGDSYAQGETRHRNGQTGSTLRNGSVKADEPWALGTAQTGRRTQHGLKSKDLMLVPARLALALQQPYYTGRIKNERDRVWLAAMIDAEGCMFIHKRKVGTPNGQGYERKSDTYSMGLEVSNCHEAIVLRCQEITGKGSICTQGPNENHRRKQTLYRWNMRSNECRDIIREVYPYLVAKKQQARIMLGCPSSGEKAEAAHVAVKALHNGEWSDVDFPEPESMWEPGWFLRSDIIWAKKNCMPESVTDRPTSSHEHVFLLTKQARYFYDAEAVREPHTSEPRRIPADDFVSVDKYGADGKAIDARRRGNKLADAYAGGPPGNPNGRNLRNVWTIATQPYAAAHFATFPPALVEPCIKAGTSEKGCCPACGAPWTRVVEQTGRVLPTTPGTSVHTQDTHKTNGDFRLAQKAGAGSGRLSFGRNETVEVGWQPSCHCDAGDPIPCTVLDPFLGAGTSLLVADRLGRNGIGIELNEQYATLARNRIVGDAPLFAEVETS